MNMFNRRVPQVPHADLIDLLLDADLETRRLLIFQALQAGSVKKSDAEEVMASVARLERAAAPRSEETARQALTEAPQRSVVRAA
jgi:hypothetical protein